MRENIQQIQVNVENLNEADTSKLNELFGKKLFTISGSINNNRIILHSPNSFNEAVQLRQLLKSVGVQPLLTNIPIKGTSDDANATQTVRIPTIFLYDGSEISVVADTLGIKGYCEVNVTQNYRLVDRENPATGENVRCIEVENPET